MTDIIAKLVTTVLGLIALCGCGISGSHSGSLDSEIKIVEGGLVQTEDQVGSHTVALTTGGASYCTGTYIQENWVLTAAHCVLPYALYQIPVTVEFGKGVKETSEQGVAVGMSIIYPEYNRSQRLGDIALVRLIRSTNLSAFAPSPLAAAKDDFTSGDAVTLAGYGTLGLGQKNTSGNLLKTSVRIRKIDDVKGVIHYEAISGNASACHGDSGGPMFIEKDGNLMTIGVTQGVDHDTEAFTDSINCRKFGIYTSVVAFKPWIDETITKVDEALATFESTQ